MASANWMLVRAARPFGKDGPFYFGDFMVRYVKGDLFESKADILAHGVNCVGGFGSGVAGQIAQKYPNVKFNYLRKYESEGWQLGDVQFLYAYGFYIANCATQQEYYPRNKVHVDYNAVKVCMEKVKEFAKNGNFTIAIPKIGAGLAGGDWNTIEKILNEVFNDYDISVYVLK